MSAKHPRLLSVVENETVINVEIKQKIDKYINEFLNLNCASDLLNARVFPNAKEITESMAAFNAVRRNLRSFGFADPKQAFGRKDIAVVCVGDGATPRTAALFAYRTHWHCYSVDPALGAVWHGEQTRRGLQRLTGIPNKVEDWKFYWATMVFIICVHSHALLQDCLSMITGSPRHLIAIPCCVPQTIAGVEPNMVYDDWAIWSPERTVKIWSYI